MVRRDRFINKIRELKYSYKDQQKRTYLYRKTGGTHTSLCRWLTFSRTNTSRAPYDKLAVTTRKSVIS